ncbi:MAG: ATP-binding cassette domain-containing protein [Gluconacetobacter diazotrophicus]|nr:ATP-binding cassette domain-containing protein [Gluconacetobacter diazotrophicus]
MWPYLRRYRGRVLGAAVALLAAAGLLLVLGQGMRGLIDRGLRPGSEAGLGRVAAESGVVIVLLAAATVARYAAVSWLGERVAADLRRDLFGHVLTLSPAVTEETRVGDLLSRLTADVAVLQALVGSALSQWLRNTVLLLGAGAMLVGTSPKLAALVMAVVPVVVAPLVLFGRRERRLSRRAQDRVADLGAYAAECFGALPTVQGFTHADVDRAVFGARNEAAVRAALGRIGVRALLIAVVIALGFGAILFALWVGGRDVIAGRLSGGSLSAFVFYAVLLASSGMQLGEVWGELQRAGGAAERLAELLALRPGLGAPAHPTPPAEPGRGELRFEGVRFRYPAGSGRTALDGIDLAVRGGETVALVGPSGAGKSTLLALIQRFRDPDAGAVRLDGIDLRRMDPEALRRRIGVVAQDPVIFGTSARENIRYGRPDADDAAVRGAALAAHAGFLFELPDGLDTFLGERGTRLSGGQKQRVAIARAILRDPAVLLLDEATSALDAESERAVQAALLEVSRGRTTVVVAHRLATVRRADRIVVMERGRIVAQGTHAALLGEGGLYARLATLQFLDGAVAETG